MNLFLTVTVAYRQNFIVLYNLNKQIVQFKYSSENYHYLTIIYPHRFLPKTC